MIEKKWKVTKCKMFVVVDDGRGLFSAPDTVACSPSPGAWGRERRQLIAAAPELLRDVKKAAELVTLLKKWAEADQGDSYEIMDEIQGYISTFNPDKSLRRAGQL